MIFFIFGFVKKEAQIIGKQKNKSELLNLLPLNLIKLIIQIIK